MYNTNLYYFFCRGVVRTPSRKMASEEIKLLLQLFQEQTAQLRADQQLMKQEMQLQLAQITANNEQRNHQLELQSQHYTAENNLLRQTLERISCNKPESSSVAELSMNRTVPPFKEFCVGTDSWELYLDRLKYHFAAYSNATETDKKHYL